ncbi:uncharacterized protein LOC123715455 [Pieris brassicae]|uniref:uncharacterized protein LOC123715455 n=1 Tax=Pieris brassicae TaxID=7116 RepID=UPI001E65E702|nr:uncharacterized protein LOC123715455 [Pieris brassicae]
MDKYLRPERFDIDPSDSSSTRAWIHWRKTFESFISVQKPTASETDAQSVPSSEWDSIKFQLLVNHISPNIYTYISEATNYEEAITILQKLYVKPKNLIFARHMLATRKQRPEEGIDTYLQALKLLSKDCDFAAVNAETNKNDSVRDAFISGISSHKIRQRLLENLTLTLDQAYNQALSLETAEINSQSFNTVSLNAVAPKAPTLQTVHDEPCSSVNNPRRRKCFFCGGQIHPRKNCPAFEKTCQLCNKKGHFATVCRSSSKATNSVVGTEDLSACITAASPSSLRKATVPAYIRGIRAEALLDTGSSISFINDSFARLCGLKRKSCNQTISMASLNHTSQVEGQTLQTLKIGNHKYDNVNLLIVKNLCADIIIGHDILEEHSSLEFSFGGPKHPLQVCNVTEASVPAVPLFANVSPNCKPIAIKSRRHSKEDSEFITEEIRNLIAEGVIEESKSPWRAQVLITKSETHRKRLVIDYSQTINRYTELDAYPLPNIEDLVSKVAKNKFFSLIDLKSAYHQVPILPKERKFTAFEALGNLYQFRRIPFGVTNGVSSFQRTIDWIIRKEKLQKTYAYIDDITICGQALEEHDRNLENFMNAAKKYGLTLSIQKCKFSQESINILGYNIQNYIIKPDSERLKPLINLPPPSDVPTLRRTLGMFAHYSKWIPNFSERIHSIANTTTFPLTSEQIKCFEGLKNDIAKSSIRAIDVNIPFTVETDASDHSIAAILTQNSRPVAFYSRTLNSSEQNHSAIEKEAYAIVESLKKWRHFLIGRHFKLVTDQRSVSFMFNMKHSSKIKNEKIQRWRLELAAFKYDIIYRPGKENYAADALSRVCATVETRTAKLFSLHEALCHPGVTRMFHWVRSKNLPYSIEEVRTMTKSCRTCSEVKPRFFRNTFNDQRKLVKATAAFERLSIDFKGPVPTNNNNKFILTVIDEFSRFPFAFPCSDVSSKTVIKHLNNLFMIFGMPSYVHSDRGTAFLSVEVQEFLHVRGIATSRTTAYNPQGNGQVEKLNSTLWKTILLALKTKNLSVENWEQVLPQALHSIRSLLCTAINCTPHERMFRHPRRSTNGTSVPSWLTNSGQVLMKKFNRTNKYQPLVEEVELIHSNPDFSYIRFPDGRETTVSNRHLAPLGSEGVDLRINNEHTPDYDNVAEPLPETEDQNLEIPPSNETGPVVFENSRELATELPSSPQPEPTVRRSDRVRKTPEFLKDYVLN